MNAWLLSGIEEEGFNKYLKFPINLFVFLSVDGRLAVSQELTQLQEGGATVVMQLLRGTDRRGMFLYLIFPLYMAFTVFNFLILFFSGFKYFKIINKQRLEKSNSLSLPLC